MSSLVTAPSLREFFRSLLEDVTRRQQVEIAQTTEFYLVNLLAEFAEADKLFQQGGGADSEPLAVLYARALQQEREERIRTLRRLGDVSLYKAGFFAPSVRESAVGTDYYVQMGGAAYGHLASLTASGFSHVYLELGQKFRALAEVLEEIAAQGMAASGPQGTLNVYESWARTGSDRLERVLIEVGVLTPKRGLPN